MNALVSMHPLAWVLIAVLCIGIMVLIGAMWNALDLDEYTDCPQCGGMGFQQDFGFGWEPPRNFDERTDSGVTHRWCPGCES